MLWMFYAIFLQPSQNVLYVDHRIVDQTANGNGQSSKSHGVDRQAKVLEYQRGDEDGYGNRCQGDDGGSNRT